MPTRRSILVLLSLTSICSAQEFREIGDLTPVTIEPVVETEVCFGGGPFHRAGSRGAALPGHYEYYAEPRGTWLPNNIKYKIRRRWVWDRPPATQQQPGCPGGSCEPPSIDYEAAGIPVAARPPFWKWTQPAAHHAAVVAISNHGARTTGVLCRIGAQVGVISCAHGKPGGGNLMHFSDGSSQTASHHPDKTGHDLSWIPLESPPPITPVEISPVAPRQGEPVEVAGFGAPSDTSSLRRFELVCGGVTNRDGNTQYRGNVLPGDSGSPVFRDGKLVGVVSKGGPPIAHIRTTVNGRGDWVPVRGGASAVQHAALAALSKRVQYSWKHAYPPPVAAGGCENGNCPTSPPVDIRPEPEPEPVQIQKPCPCEISVGEVTTLPPGSQASATLVKEGSAYVLNLGIPCGDAGLSGPAGPEGKPGPAGLPGKDVDEERLLERAIALMKDSRGPLQFKARTLVHVRDEVHRGQLAKVEGVTFEQRKGRTYAVMGEPATVKVDEEGGTLNIIHAFDVRTQ